MLRLRLACLATALPLLASLPAAAQGLTSGGLAGKGFSPIQGVGPKHTQHEAAPPGIPGAQARDPAAAPELQLDVPPTEALFDAINRGDMNTVRDALNRGADINGRNVLGMTPLDLSIDLSRNDITFLLLSMRSQAAVSGPPPTAQAAAPPAGKAGRKGLAQARMTERRQSAEVAASTTAHAVPVSTAPVRYAGVPSTPVPQAGFLGFGTTATP